MPYRASGNKVYEKRGGKWVLIKTFSKGKKGRTPAGQARAYATALNMAHARKKGYDVPPARP